MLFAPSPSRRGQARRAGPSASGHRSARRRSARSARIWHGWNSSVSALTTGTPACAAISSIRSWSKVRQTIAATCRSSTRAVSGDRLAGRRSAPGCRRRAGGSPRARRCRRRRRPASAGSACRRGRRRPRALEGLPAERVGLDGEGQLEDLALLGRGEVVVPEEVPGHQVSLERSAGRDAASRIAGRASTKSPAWARVSTSGGASRIASGGHRVDDEACLERGRATAGATSSVELDRRAGGPRPGHPRRRGWSTAPSAVRSHAPRSRTWARRPSRSMTCEGREGRGRGDRVAAERRAVLADAQQGAGPLPERDDRADREAAAEALGEGDDVGHDPAADARRGGRTTRPCARCRSAPRRGSAARRARRGELAGRGEVARRAADRTPGLALDRARRRAAATSSSIAAAERLDVTERDVLDAAGQRLERLPVGHLVRSARGRPWCARGSAPSRARTPGPARAPRHLERRLVRLGARVARGTRGSRPAPPWPPARGAARRARSAWAWRRSSRRARGCRAARRRRSRAWGARGRGR